MVIQQKDLNIGRRIKIKVIVGVIKVEELIKKIKGGENRGCHPRREYEK